MDLFLVPNNPEHTVLVSPNGVAHYQVRTHKLKGSTVSRIQRPAESEEDSVVGEVEWGRWDRPTVVRSPLFNGPGSCVGLAGKGVRAMNFLYKHGKFSSARYFIGNDNAEYRWKMVRGIGSLLTRCDNNEEIARYTYMLSEEGVYAGEKKSILRIRPLPSVDIDLVILTFMIMEKKRRDHEGDGTRANPHDEDPQGEGCTDVGGEA